jgi:hypothetical protein
MKTQRIQIHCGNVGCALLVFVLLVALTASASAEIIPSSRKVIWQGNVGVSGDIPNRTTIYANVKDAPYNAVGNGIADDTNAIQDAINNCPSGQVVYIPPGTYKTTRTINIGTSRSNITVRGAGMGGTIIKPAASFSGSKVMQIEPTGYYSWNLSNEYSRNITGGLTKGSTNITTSDPHGWSIGHVIHIDQLQNPTGNPPIDCHGWEGGETFYTGGRGCETEAGCRIIGQMVKITAVPTPTTATLEIPLYWNYDATKSPQGTRVRELIRNTGVEDLTLDNSNRGAPESVFQFTNTDNCWLLRVDMLGAVSWTLRMYGTYRTTVRGCKIHDTAGGLGSGSGYGIHLNPWGSGNLFEDNIFYHVALALTMNGAVSGNVFAYNYITDMWHMDSQAGLGTGASYHGAYPVMNLHEGNYSDGNFAADYIHGPSSYNTWFRNKIKGEDKFGFTSGNFLIILTKYAHYYNIVGNILGRSGGIETIYEKDGTQALDAGRDKVVYVLGYRGGGDYNPANSDAKVKATLLRHGNYDYVTNRTVWDAGIPDLVLPNSYYLSSKPSFFGSCAWPPIGPDLSPMVKTLPAKARYEDSSICQGDSPSPQPPKNLKIVNP